ncbi:hypothetical protein KKH96_02415 [Patescibacteria group bacterium]|nr:hypothetical protein [Patescibacteria group bacterium]
MQLFSKRNQNKIHQRFISEYSRRSNSFISNELRTRLAAEISFLTSMDDFLEFFILFENQKKESIFLDENKINGFSLSELGYKMTDFFQFEDFAVKELEYSQQIPTRNETDRIKRQNEGLNYFDDFKLFDLIEFVILFSKKSKRKEVIERFNNIYLEENSKYEIINGMITKKYGEDIYTIKNLLEDQNLKIKIEDYEYYSDREDYINMAKVSAEIVNIIFSNQIQKKKKTEINKILKKTAIFLGLNKKDQDALYDELDSVLSNIKNFNNKIYNIRHTEKSTIHLKKNCQEILYKVVAEKNITFIEMIILALKDDFIFSEDWEKIKNTYINKYKIKKDQRYVIEKPGVNVADIPF